MSPSTDMREAAPPLRRWPRLVTRSWSLALAGVAATALVVLGAASVASAAPLRHQPPAGARDTVNPVDAQRAVATYQALQDDLYIPQYRLYQKSDPTQNFGYLWDFVNPFAATDYMAAIPGIGDRYRGDMEARDEGILDYYDTQESSPTGQAQPPAFASGVRPPLGSEQPTYYDDNAWVGLDFLEEYALVHQRSDLARAEGVFHFVVSGWDTRTNVACPGGVFWEDVASSPRNTISNAPNAEAGLEIYQATHDRYYLTWATRMYDWVRGCLMNANDMYYDHLDDSGSVNTALWSYNQGTMIGAGVLLYQVTGDRTYLQQAEQTAAASVSFYGSDGNLYHQPDVFNSIFFRNLFALAKINHDASYARMAASYADTAWLQNRQPSGLFADPDPTGGESLENQTAPMAEIYALLAQNPPVFAATGSTSPSSVIVQPGESGSAMLALQSVTGRPQAVKWTASAPSGFTVTPSSGILNPPAGGTANTPVAITGGTTDGNFQVTFKFTSRSGAIQPISTSVIVARPGDLAPFFNNTGISDDTNQAAGNLDGLGFSYSEQALTAAGLAPGAAITSDGVQYNWPGVAAGQPDNLTAAGQVITVPPVSGATELGVMGSATNGPSSGTLTITYAGGTTQSATLGFTDWTSGSASFGNGTAASMSYRNSAGGSSQQIGTKVFTTNIPLQPGKTVASVTLPSGANQGLLHIFALGTDKGPLTTGG
ncbi:MAG TPA: glycoside hydrolase family 76 protein [Solirubrobacteraceae bacterium]|nr:glycoside hydrolase family 76 protein [Solirubrobacteraceae bacterium]